MRQPPTPPSLRAAREKAGFPTAEELADVLSVPSELVQAWEEGAVQPNSDEIAGLSGAFRCSAADIEDLIQVHADTGSRVATLVRSAIAVVGFAPGDLNQLLGVSSEAAGALLTTGALDGIDEADLAYEIDIELAELQNAARLDRADTRVSGGTSLEEVHPHLALQYDSSNTLPPDQLRHDTNLPVSWRCERWPQHTWLATPAARLEQNCPACTEAIPTSLVQTHPELASEWHPDNSCAPTEETAGSVRRRVWLCTNGHRWSATPTARLSGEVDCPECVSIYALRPDLSREWHRDNRHPASRVPLRSTRPAVWHCSLRRQHVWVATPAERAEDPRCPLCASVSFTPAPPVASYPKIAEEWDDPRDPQLVSAAEGSPAKWRCRSGHKWSASPAARIIAGIGCAACERGWDKDKLRNVVAALGSEIYTLSPAELFTLFQQAKVGADSQEVAGALQALSLGLVEEDELAAFAQGRASKLDTILEDPEAVRTATFGMDLRLREPTWLGGGLSAIPDDTTAADFLVASGVARLLAVAFEDREAAEREAAKLASGTYTERVRENFLSLIRRADQLETPPGWKFAPGGAPAQPNLMQKIVAVRVRDERRIGNWSGTGAGKTVSALLASRTVDADITLITCPNAVVRTWVDAVNGVFPGQALPYEKTLTAPPPGSGPVYLVVNYEHLQRPAAPAELATLAASGRVGMMVIDEVHQAKQRDERTLSLRRKNLQLFLNEAGINNPQLRVLGMSATPVINSLSEGASLLRLITGNEPAIGVEPTIANCMALHQELVRSGIRWMPQYEAALAYQEIPVDCSDELEELRALPSRAGVLAIEQILTRARIRAMTEQLRPKTLVYTHLRSGIVEQLTDAFEQAGHKTGCFTGVDKSGLPGFLDGDVDVLVATSSIGTGVDGLQRVCSRVLVNVLPWTDADYTQLKGRVWRQGQQADKVDFIVPVTQAELNGELWSWCRMKLDRLQYKRSIADAAVDGSIPDEYLRTPEQAAQDALAWLGRLSAE